MWMESFVAFLVGVIFAIGLATAGLLDPEVVLGFLDVAGNWNPGPVIVIGTAVVVYGVGFRILSRRKKPFFAEVWHLPAQNMKATHGLKSVIDRRLILGAILFGIGWGLAGFCPGPAIAGAVFGKGKTTIFLAAMILGALIFQIVHERRRKRA